MNHIEHTQYDTSYMGPNGRPYKIVEEKEKCVCCDKMMATIQNKTAYGVEWICEECLKAVMEHDKELARAEEVARLNEIAAISAINFFL